MVGSYAFSTWFWECWCGHYISFASCRACCLFKQMDTLGYECFHQFENETVVDGDWHDAMSRTNQKLENAYRVYPTKSWPERILRGKFCSAAKIACRVNHWPVLCSRWQPGYGYERNFHVQLPRRPGRPPKRWDDQLRVFFGHVFHSFIMDDCCPSWGTMVVPWTGFCAPLFRTMMIE